MRLDPLLDSFYFLGSVWSSVASPSVCTPHAADLPRAARVAVGVEGRPAVTAFIDVHVVPMDTERVLANQTVLVEGGRITALGPASQVLVPAGAVRVDGRGKYLVPGLGDMHPHGRRHDAQLQQADVRRALFRKLASGVTTLREIVGGTLTPEQLKRHFETAETPIPRMYISPGIRGTNSGKVLLAPDSVAAAVAAAKAEGYHHIGIQRRGKDARTLEFFDSLVAAARRVGLPIADHDSWLPLEKTLALGTTGGSTEHLYTFLNALGYPTLYTTNGRQPRASPDSAVPEVSRSELQALATAAQRAGIWVTPTLSCTELKYAHLLHPTYTKLLRQILMALQEAGVGLLLSADDGWDVHDELAALVRAGLTPYQALATGTRNVAAFYKLLDSTGTVAVGKRADLVLLNGNPLENVGHAREPAGVMIDGRWLSRAMLDRHRSTP